MTGIENVFRESIPLDLFSMGPISIPWAHSAIGIKLFDLKKKVNNIFPLPTFTFQKAWKVKGKNKIM
jgi:hypothetical protein